MKILLIFLIFLIILIIYLSFFEKFTDTSSSTNIPDQQLINTLNGVKTDIESRLDRLETSFIIKPNSVDIPLTSNISQALMRSNINGQGQIDNIPHFSAKSISGVINNPTPGKTYTIWDPKNSISIYGIVSISSNYSDRSLGPIISINYFNYSINNDKMNIYPILAGLTDQQLPGLGSNYGPISGPQMANFLPYSPYSPTYQMNPKYVLSNTQNQGISVSPGAGNTINMLFYGSGTPTISMIRYTIYVLGGG